MYVQRELEHKLVKYMDRREVLAVVGPRQVGKTTLLKHMYGQLEVPDTDKEFITFENRSNRRLFQDIEDFKTRYRNYQYLFIDEFQYAREGGQKLKYLFDTTETKFIISGSSALDLTFKTQKYLVGRMFLFNLWPFSFREYLQSASHDLKGAIEERIPDALEGFDPQDVFGEELNRQLREHYHNFIVWGGYPAVVSAEDDPDVRRTILRANFDAYLLKEIKDLLSLATDEELTRLTVLLASQVGGLINYNELGNTSNLTFKSTKNHLNILQKTFLIDLVRPYFSNKRTEIVKNPKVYFIDTGFRNYRINDFRQLNVRNDAGALVENSVYMALRRRFAGEENTSIKYWRTKNKAEVDFIIDLPDKIIPLEVKYSNNPTPGKSFYSFLRKYNPEKAFILTKGHTEFTEIEGTRVYFLPAFYL